MSEMLKGMITEEELLKLMNLKPSELSYLRHEKGLPYVKLSMRRRVYLEEDLMEWFKGHRFLADPTKKDEVSTPTHFKAFGTDADEDTQTQNDTDRGL